MLSRLWDILTGRDKVQREELAAELQYWKDSSSYAWGKLEETCELDLYTALVDEYYEHLRGDSDDIE